MIDFYKKADEKRRGELDFVSDAVEEKFMLLLVPERRRVTVNKPLPAASTCTRAKTSRIFCDVFYEHA
jgi:hypothetical protein